MSRLPSLIRHALSLACAVACLAATAQEREDPQSIRTAIESFLRKQTSGLSGQASFSISPLDTGAVRQPCRSLEVSMAPGARTIGRSTVLVRCRSEAAWAIYVPVHIKVIGDYLVSARPLSPGQLIGETDLARQSGDLGDLPSGILLDPALAIGRSVAIPLPAGRPLLSEQLRQPPVIQQGQTVKVISRGPAFEVANEGRALTSAAEGKVVQVRLNSGQVVSGLARNGGIVEISF